MTSRYCLNSRGYIPPGYISPGYIPPGYISPGYIPRGCILRGCILRGCIPLGCIPHGCIPCLERFNAKLVYYVESANEYIESGKLRKLFDFSYLFNVSQHHSSTQTDFNYVSVDCEDCQTNESQINESQTNESQINECQINDWDIV